MLLLTYVLLLLVVVVTLVRCDEADDMSAYWRARVTRAVLTLTRLLLLQRSNVTQRSMLTAAYHARASCESIVADLAQPIRYLRPSIT